MAAGGCSCRRPASLCAHTKPLSHLGAREYDPVTGTFLTPDPVLDTDKPAHLNAYGYGYGNPVSNSGPSGMEPMLEQCKKADDRRACANYGYTGSPHSRFDRDDHFYDDLDMSAIWYHNWNRAGLARDRKVSLKNGPRPTRERIESIYIEFHPEVQSFDKLLELGWEMTGTPDIAKCATDPDWESCAGAALAFFPGAKLGKLAKSSEGLAKLAKAAGIERAIKYGTEGEDELSYLSRLECAVGAARSFTSDTLVLMADGAGKPISEVRVGDRVANSEPDGKGLQLHLVTAVHVTDDDHDLIDITLAGVVDAKPVVTTVHHQFWEARTHRWVEAGSLQGGDQLALPGGEQVTVLAVQRRVGQERTFDLTVDSVHTYYVTAGNAPVLVHNTGPFCGVPDKLPEGWGLGKVNKKGVGWRWQDPKNPGNGVRIDQGSPSSPFSSQTVDHVIVRSNGRVIGRDGKPISGAITDDLTNAHIPFEEWKTWSSWDHP